MTIALDSLYLARLQPEDAPDLLAFETTNRAYFERWVAARNPGFYSLDGVAAAIDEAQRQHQADKGHQFLIKLDSRILGRINLSAVERKHFNVANLGYRLGEAYTGQGVATRAAQLMLAEAYGTLKLGRLVATVRSGNLGSLRVLERAGFTVFGKAERCMQMHGQWHDLLYYERRSVAMQEGVAHSMAELPAAATS